MGVVVVPMSEFEKSVMAPAKVPQGQRKRQAKKGAHKNKPKPGKGQYVKAPLLRDKVANPRWTANALINNPGSSAAVGAVGAAGALQAAKGHMNQKHRDQTTAAQGALVGGAAGKSANDASWYAGKKAARKGISQVSHKGEYGPYKEGPHQAEFKRLSRASNKAASGKGPRAKAAYFHENYPAGAPGAQARKLMTLLDQKPTKAGFAVGGAAAGLGAVKAHQKVSKGRVMSDAEIKHRKQVQGKISRTTSTLGLASLGALGAAAAAKKPGGAAYGTLKKLPGLKKVGSPAAMHDKLKSTALNTGIVSSGIGGVGGYNFAAYTNAESRKRKPVAKRDEMAPEFGEFAKAWSPVGPQFDSENNRHKRNKVAEQVTGGVGGASVAVGAGKAGEGALKVHNTYKTPPRPKGMHHSVPLTPGQLNWQKGQVTRGVKAGTKTMKTGGKLVAVGAGALAASHAISRKRKGDWQSYSKSAFGITHD